MPIVSYRGHVLMVEGWEKSCVEGNEPLLRKMVTLEEFTSEENAYMEQCHQKYDARRAESDQAFANTVWFIFGLALVAIAIAAIVEAAKWLWRLKK